jgi:hypothetical protein
MNQNSPAIKEMSHGQRSASSSRLGLLIILIAFAGLGLLYDLTVPMFEKPDELKHFAVIQYIQTERQLPVVEEGVYQPWDQEGTQPPLYHLLAAAATAWLDLSDFREPSRNPHYVDERSFIWRERGNNNLYLHPPGEAWRSEPMLAAARLARWLSLLAGLGTVFLTYLLARLTFAGESPWLPLLAAALVAFIPQFLHVNSAITNDSLSATIAAAALVGLALVIKNGSSVRYALLLGAVLGLGTVTKLSLLSLVPLTGLVLLLDWRWRRHRSLRHLLAHGAIIGGLILLLSGWWFWRNWLLYGDIAALNAHLLYRGGPLDPRPGLPQIWQTELTGLELSFWAAFGAGQILLEPWIYEVLRWVKYLMLMGVVLGVWRLVSRQSSVVIRQLPLTEASHDDNDKFGTQHDVLSTQISILFLLILWILIIFIALLRWMQITPASWGRLLYPASPAMAVLAVWGLAQFWVLDFRSWIYRLAPNANRSSLTDHGSRIRAQPPRGPDCALQHPLALLLPALLVMVLFILAVIGPFRYINIAYAKTSLISEAEVPLASIEPLDFTYADSLRLIGYSVERTPVQPGEWLPVTLYWQAIRPIDRNYSVFVHLLGRDNRVIGQANTYPDGGNWPTSMLPPGLVLPDTYFVPVSAQAEAPAVIRLALGIFEFEDPERAAKPAVDAAGEPVEPIVGAVPLLPHDWPELEPSIPLEANFGGQIELVGYDWPHPATIKPGETASLTFYWHALASPGQDLNLFIHLIDPVTGAQVAGFDGPPEFPTEFWQPGYAIEDFRRLTFPPDLPAGDYELRIGWYDLETFTRLPLANGIGDSLTLLTVNIE